MIRQILFFTFAGLTLTACLKDKSVEPIPTGACADTVYFNDDLLVPLFNNSCNVSGCHSAEDAAAGRIFVAHDSISNHADEIFLTISHDVSKTPMPIGGDKIADSLIQKFDCWIQQGKLDN
ncbi:MAG: hypothetical protein P8I55_03605 [Crocinitomix sp.]|nr:hypothetical protein [Crocinitomix sp.]